MTYHSLAKTTNAQDDAITPRAAAWAILTLTCLLMMVDFIDRQIVVSILPHIKSDWGLNDTQLGALISVVSLTVGLFSIPVAMLADRWSRVKCIFLMALVWSLATTACSIARSYDELLALRAIVGVGEAGYGAVGTALLARYFPSRMRAGVFAVFNGSAAVGAVLGVLLGGVLARHWGWHATFGIVGVPGLFLAFLYLLVRDYPTVGLLTVEEESSGAKAGVGHMLRLLAKAPAALLVYIGSAFQLFVVATVYSWLPSHFGRAYGMPADQAGIRAAAVLLIGSLGAIVWGIVADRVSKDNPRNKIWVMIACCLSSCAVLSTAFAAVPPGPLQFALITLGAFLMTGTIGTVGAVAVDVAHRGVRATTLAVGALLQNLLGLAAGPYITGVISDRYGLATALAVAPLMGLVAAFALGAIIRVYDRDRARAMSGT